MKQLEQSGERELVEQAREKEWRRPSFVADLFMGKFRFDPVYPYPGQSAEERAIGDRFLCRLDHFLGENLDADEVDRTGQIPEKVMKGLAEMGAFGMKISKEYGGLGLSNVNYARAMGVVARHCDSTAATLSAHQSIGVAEPLLLFGSEEQKRKYLPRVAHGAVSAFALTEPGVGSDPAHMKTTATPTEDGKAFILDGTKLWCTNGVIAEILVVMAQTPVVENGRNGKRITAFIVERNMPGFEVMHRCRFMGLNGIQNGLLRFNQVRVPRENVIWDVGKGLHLALATLNAGRISLPAATIGSARAGFDIARTWANERVQWGVPIGRHEAIGAKLARMSADLYAMEATTFLVSSWLDRKSFDVRVESAMAKVFCSERAFYGVHQALQICGGRGYERASSLKQRGETPFPIERMFRDSRINQIVEGTSEILRLFIAREGLDAHLRLAGGVFDKKNSLWKRAAIALKAAAFYATWYPRLWIPGSRYRGHLRFIDLSAKRLARTAFHLMVRYGPSLEKHQLQLMRLVDIAMQLFAVSAVVSRARTEHQKTGEMLPPEAELFYLRARKRVHALFAEIQTNQDHQVRKVADEALIRPFIPPTLPEEREEAA